MASAVASTSKGEANRRLYVGNLAETVDEYMVTKLFGKYGRITRLDFLFHNTGPLKGKPRGFAFVEMETVEQASNAMIETNDKLLRGKRISVSWADPSAYKPPNQNAFAYVTDASGQRRRIRKGQSDSLKPTPLSLLKATGAPSSTDAKIRALEDKLRFLKESDTRNVPDEGFSNLPDPQRTHIPESAMLPPKPEMIPGAFDADSGFGANVRKREGTLAQSAEVLRLAQTKKAPFM